MEPASYRDAQAAPAGVRHRRRSGTRWRRRARRGQRWGRPRWCCTTCPRLYFETDAGDGFREPGFSKERRLEPQITIGLLTDASGFPLMVEAFEGNKAETATMLPTIARVQAAHGLAGRHRRRRRRDGLARPTRTRSRPPGCPSSSARGSPQVPYVITAVAPRAPRREPSRTGMCFTEPWPRRPDGRAPRPQVVYYQYRHDRARRTLRGHRRAGRARPRRPSPGKIAGQTEPVRPASPAAPAASTATWRPRPGRWPG